MTIQLFNTNNKTITKQSTLQQKHYTNKKKYLLNNILIYLTIINIYIYCTKSVICSIENTQIPLKNNASIYQAEKNVNMIYNKTGQLVCKLITSHIQLLHHMKFAQLQQPIAILFDQHTKPAWEITATQATINNDKIMFLYGNVQIKNLMHNPYLQYIKTNTAKINLITQDVTSKQVSINGICFQTIAKNMHTNLQQKISTLSNTVHTSYIVKKNENALHN